MAEHTLTYSEGVKGFPSFYSYIPDMMVGMNNYFYSLKNGNLWRHNTNTERNKYYDVAYPSTISSVFNNSPLENKLFKTINLESDNKWGVTLQTDIQTNGSIDRDWFVKKEAAWFAFIRTPNDNPMPDSEFFLRSVNGIADCASVVGSGTANAFVNFALTVDIGSIVSIGDFFYFGVAPTYTPQFAGPITEININLVGGINQLKIDNSPTVLPLPPVVPLPAAPFFCMYVKNATAESHGVVGHYCEFVLTLPNIAPDFVGSVATELFAVESEVMKSYP